MSNVKVVVGGSLKTDLDAFRSTWKQVEGGGSAEVERVLAFESWEGLSSVLTGERYRLLRHLHAHPEPSVSALARSLDRQFRRVHADVVALEAAGLVERTGGEVKTTTDRIRADIEL